CSSLRRRLLVEPSYTRPRLEPIDPHRLRVRPQVRHEQRRRVAAADAESHCYKWVRDVAVEKAASPQLAQVAQKVVQGERRKRSGSGEPLSRSSTPRQPVVSKYVSDETPACARYFTLPAVHAAPSSESWRGSTGSGSSPAAATGSSATATELNRHL